MTPPASTRVSGRMKRPLGRYSFGEVDIGPAANRWPSRQRRDVRRRTGRGSQPDTEACWGHNVVGILGKACIHETCSLRFMGKTQLHPRSPLYACHGLGYEGFCVRMRTCAASRSKQRSRSPPGQERGIGRAAYSLDALSSAQPGYS